MSTSLARFAGAGTGVGRRALLSGLGAATLATALPRGPAAAPARTGGSEGFGWAQFRDRYVAADGRVVDTGNGGISHSEGQGYGLLLAEAHNDQPAFEAILGWTRRVLRRPSDGLHAWRFRNGQTWVADDPNNATDGDLYIAWALGRAASRWNVPEWRHQARDTARAILAKTVVNHGGRTLLLPGSYGFLRGETIEVNPSYYAFPAIRAMNEVLPDPRWARLEQEGLRLLRDARFGRWALPADWVEVNGAGAVLPSSRNPARFSYDAVRVPLHLAWIGEQDEPAVAAAHRFWTDPSLPGPLAWTDLRTGSVAAEGAPAGVTAIAGTVAQLAGLGAVARGAGAPQDYYSAVLVLLAGVALREAPRPGYPAPSQRGVAMASVPGSLSPVSPAAEESTLSVPRLIVRRAAAALGLV